MLLYIMGQNELDRKTINSLKGIGILGVMLVHYGLRTSDKLILGIVFQGARGVQLMLIINAFLIFHSLSKIEFNRKSILEWWKGKFIRLIPLYWFFTILYLAIFGTGPSYYLGILPRISSLNILCNLFFLHGFFPYYTNCINTNWFMGVLAIFYILAPFIYRIINSLEKSIVSLFIIVPIGYIINNLLSAFNILEVEGIWLDYINIFSFSAEFPIVLLGILSFFIYRLICEKKLKNKRLIGMSMLLFSVICLLSLFLRKDYFVIFNDIFSFGIVLTIVFLSQLIYPIFLVKNKIFEFVGKHSYGIYLSHLIVLRYINQLLGERRNEKMIDIIGYFLLILISCIFSVVSEKVIEEKAIKYLKGYRKK